MKPQKIKGLYLKRESFYYQPPTGENGVRPKAIALGTKDLLEAINLAFSERDRFQLVAATVKDRMSPAIDLYLKEKLAARKHTPKTSYNTGKALHQICMEMGNPKLSEINEKKIEEWATNLRARKCRVAIRLKESACIVRERKKTSVSDSSIAAYSRILRAFITWCHEKGKILKKPSKSIPSGRCKKTRKMRFTSFEERDLLLDRATKPELAFIYHVGFLAGLRFGEMLAMEPDWLWFSEDGKHGKIHVQETRYWKPKDKEAREIPMAPRLLEFLKKWPIKGGLCSCQRRTFFPNLPNTDTTPKSPSVNMR